ncbi:ATP-binding cassette domain-containing protein [Aeromonas sp. 2HA2]|uniref:ABC transporter ATP-binding protein n=1 Tax=bacterium 19CA06SA08-2 TaxID=2920658 RepID=A0AAU6U688_UNCXX|nr:ABC transporter ATP-binding protein [Aeromonas sp. 2HA2]MDF2408720.1 ATP-binding cassette domain-containing protein [Aeromonas sp. 2HA2]
MSCLQVENVSCRYNGRNVLEQLSLSVADNEIVCLLGASGCGKTTLLKAVAGLLPLAEGEIRLGATLLDGPGVSVPPEARNIGMIFQDYALFPHLTVADNVGFGLARLDRPARQQQVEEALTLVKLQGLGDRYPHQLSGGQQQRVAIARALVCKPKLMLLDEPFSNIDTQVRMKLILEIRTLLKQQGIGAIFVSHSKEEAFAFADRLALFRAGHIEQVGQPEQLYRRPQNRFVAEFLGGVNYLAAEVVDSHSVKTALGVVSGCEPHGRNLGELLQLMLRPQQLLLEAVVDGELTVLEQQFLGHHCRVLFECGGQRLEASIGEPLGGDRARVKVAPHGLVLFEPVQ